MLRTYQFLNARNAVSDADWKAQRKKKKYMVVYSSKTNSYHVRQYGKYTVYEELTYITDLNKVLSN